MQAFEKWKIIKDSETQPIAEIIIFIVLFSMAIWYCLWKHPNIVFYYDDDDYDVYDDNNECTPCDINALNVAYPVTQGFNTVLKDRTTRENQMYITFFKFAKDISSEI